MTDTYPNLRNLLDSKSFTQLSEEKQFDVFENVARVIEARYPRVFSDSLPKPFWEIATEFKNLNPPARYPLYQGLYDSALKLVACMNNDRRKRPATEDHQPAPRPNWSPQIPAVNRDQRQPIRVPNSSHRNTSSSANGSPRRSPPTEPTAGASAPVVVSEPTPSHPPSPPRTVIDTGRDPRARTEEVPTSTAAVTTAPPSAVTIASSSTPVLTTVPISQESATPIVIDSDTDANGDRNRKTKSPKLPSPGQEEDKADEDLSLLDSCISVERSLSERIDRVTTNYTASQVPLFQNLVSRMRMQKHMQQKRLEDLMYIRTCLAGTISGTRVVYKT